MSEQRPLAEITDNPAFQTFCRALRDVTVRAAVKAAEKKPWPFAALTIRREVDQWKKRVGADPAEAILIVADFAIQHNSAVAALAENQGIGHWYARALAEDDVRDMLLLVEREPQLVFGLWLAFGHTRQTSWPKGEIEEEV